MRDRSCGAGARHDLTRARTPTHCDQCSAVRDATICVTTGSG